MDSTEKSNKIAKDLDPGIILQSLDNEEVWVSINGKRKRVRKAEIEFRELFSKAIKGDLTAAMLISNMFAIYLGPEKEGPSENTIVVARDSPLQSEDSMTAKSQSKTGRPVKSSARAKKPIVSASYLFQKVAREKIAISIRGRRGRMTLMEAYLRQVQIMARKDVKALRLLIHLRKRFPGPLVGGDPVVVVISEADARF